MYSIGIRQSHTLQSPPGTIHSYYNIIGYVFCAVLYIPGTVLLICTSQSLHLFLLVPTKPVPRPTPCRLNSLSNAVFTFDEVQFISFSFMILFFVSSVGNDLLQQGYKDFFPKFSSRSSLVLNLTFGLQCTLSEVGCLVWPMSHDPPFCVYEMTKCSNNICCKDNPFFPIELPLCHCQKLTVWLYFFVLHSIHSCFKYIYFLEQTLTGTKHSSQLFTNNDSFSAHWTLMTGAFNISILLTRRPSEV